MLNLSQELERDIKREVLKDSYYEFFKWAFDLLHPSSKYEDNFHVKYLCDLLQEEAERILRLEEKDLDILINIPPRTSKSLIFSVCFLPWVWIKNPAKKFITVSFDAQLALVNAQLSRDIIAHPEYQELFGDCYAIRGDADSKGYFLNNYGGYRLSRTTGQNITGFSADFIIVDDPDSAMSVYSPTEREFVHKYYFEALYNRLTPPTLGVRIVLQQRLHEMDLTGAILERQPKNYQHICLPAELNGTVTPAHLGEFYTNGLLDPRRLSITTLMEFKSTLGTKGYTGQYLQSPSPDEGGIFKRDWFDIVSPMGLLRDPINNPVHFFLDTAYTEKQENDPSAILTCYKKDNMLYILDVHEVWMEFPALVKHITNHVQKYQYNSYSKIFVEPKASGKSLVQQLRASTQLNVVELEPPKESKVTRANAVSPICESKRVKLIEGGYVTNFVDQITTFPHAVHDDMLDDLVHAVDKLLKKDASPDFIFI